MEKKDVIRNIIVVASEFKFGEISREEFEQAVNYYVEKLVDLQE